MDAFAMPAVIWPVAYIGLQFVGARLAARSTTVASTSQATISTRSSARTNILSVA